MHGMPFDLSTWAEDSSLMAFNYHEKISDWWLDEYEAKRRELNKDRTGMKHRKSKYYGLKTLAPYFLNVKPFWEPEGGHNDIEYVLKDARYTLELTKFFKTNMTTKAYEFYRSKQLEWVKTLLRAEMVGVCIDEYKLKDLWDDTNIHLKQYEKQIETQWAEHYQAWDSMQRETIEAKYDSMAKARKNLTPKLQEQYAKNKERALARVEPLNLNSPAQLLWLLEERLGLRALNLDGEESTDKETLKRLSKESAEVATLLDYRKAQKLCSTYFPEYQNFIFKGRIHATFNPTGARTGRLSCSEPNLQQVPPILRQCFVSEEGKMLVTKDLSAIEPTMLAYYSEDPILCDLMLRNGDFHSVNAIAIFQLDCEETEVKERYSLERKVAKECGLSVLYGAGPKRVHQILQKYGLHEYTESDAKRFVYRVRDLYEGVWTFKEELDKVLESGEAIYNYMGRPIYIQDKNEVYMKGLNTLIQSSASDLLQEAATKISATKIGAPLLLVHDELVVQVDANEAIEAEAKIVEIMTSFALPTKHGQIKIKTEGKVGHHWEK